MGKSEGEKRVTNTSLISPPRPHLTSVCKLMNNKINSCISSPVSQFKDEEPEGFISSPSTRLISIIDTDMDNL